METTENKSTVKETARIEAFSDGVFAIAITLLILEIHVPEVKGNESLYSALFHEWPSFLAFLIGFFTILICWINHHYMFEKINRSNSTLLWLNGFKLLVVTITPFATAVLARHIAEPVQLPDAVNLFCLNFAFMGLAMTGIWAYANSQGFVTTLTPVEAKCATRLYFLAGMFSTSIWLISFLSFWASLGLSAIMFCIFLSPKSSIKVQLGRRLAQANNEVDAVA